MPDSIDLGYSWRWTYGHLVPMTVLGAAAVVSLSLGAPWWVWIPLLVLGVWMLAGFLVMRLGVRMNEIPRFTVGDFLPGASGRMLDVGCGSGRLGIAIARARPTLSVVGLDNFSADYIAEHGSTNTERNFAAADVADRATVRGGDMRDMPFADGEFDAAASSAAIDHLADGDIRVTLGEVHRVLRPDGQFLLLVVVPCVWLWIAWGPSIAGKLQPRAYWRRVLDEAGFRVEREGTVRTTAMFLTKRVG